MTLGHHLVDTKPSDERVQMSVSEDRKRLFELLASDATVPRFFEHVADDVDWTVMGSHPLAGRYTNKRAFLAATFDVLGPLMEHGISLHVVEVHVAGAWTIAELRAESTTKQGVPFDNTYCWVCRFDDEQIVEVRAYLDSALLSYALGRAAAVSTRS
jgi:uncharacterized protein